MLMYDCDCCGRINVPFKLKGIGYVCKDCLVAWTWTGYESGLQPDLHYPVCPFRVTRGGIKDMNGSKAEDEQP
jgi:hypothetical protein